MQIITALIVYILSFFFPKKQPPVFLKPYTIPYTIATPSAILEPRTQPLATPLVPWGTTEKIADHLYRTYVGQDKIMGTPQEILTALNFYRKNHGLNQPLRFDENLCILANRRAAEQDKLGTLDAHQGLVKFMDDPKNWTWLDITSIGENASYGYTLSGTHLIEWVFDADEEHKSNQLNPQWNLACPGISDTTVDILFGKR